MCCPALICLELTSSSRLDYGMCNNISTNDLARETQIRFPTLFSSGPETRSWKDFPQGPPCNSTSILRQQHLGVFAPTTYAELPSWWSRRKMVKYASAEIERYTMVGQNQAKAFKIRQWCNSSIIALSLIVIEDCISQGDRIVIPQQFRNQILNEIHYGHPGYVRMNRLLKLDYSGPW